MVISDEKKRWKWDDEKVCNLIVSLYDMEFVKVKKDFEGTDMEADLVTMYEDIRQLMAALYPEEAFGPIEALHLQADASDKEKVKLQRLISNQKQLIKMGYFRVKSKVKQLRQNFKKAIINGTRSGSGKLLIEHWDQLVIIWGGCPSVKKIDGAVMSMANHTSHTSTDSESEVANFEINEDYSEEETSAYVRSRKLAKEGSSDGVPQKSNLVDNK